jgi:hypothetical protein
VNRGNVPAVHSAQTLGPPVGPTEADDRRTRCTRTGLLAQVDRDYAAGCPARESRVPAEATAGAGPPNSMPARTAATSRPSRTPGRSGLTVSAVYGRAPIVQIFVLAGDGQPSHPQLIGKIQIDGCATFSAQRCHRSPSLTALRISSRPTPLLFVASLRQPCTAPAKLAFPRASARSRLPRGKLAIGSATAIQHIEPATGPSPRRIGRDTTLQN